MAKWLHGYIFIGLLPNAYRELVLQYLIIFDTTVESPDHEKTRPGIFDPVNGIVRIRAGTQHLFL